jgi:putative transposase
MLHIMKLIARVKLLPAGEQGEMLRVTLERANEACSYISERAWESKAFRQFPIHRLTYRDVRERFGLSAQMVVRAVARVADAYKAGRERLRRFSPHGAFPYDDRILSWNLAAQTVSIWTLAGRQTIPFTGGMRDLELLQTRRGESDLCYVRGKWYLLATCDVDEPEPIDVEGYLGVDLGVTNIATDSDGDIHSAGHVRGLRRRHARRRARLQSVGTKSARRRLRQRSGRERRFATDVNHGISKQLVEKAKRTGWGIALEELSGIRGRARAHKPQRRELHSWSFAQLRAFIEYKAALAGVPVVFVDPRNTSRTCPACGLVDKANRRSQDTFLCVLCGCAGHADHFAAVNISRRAAVNRPIVSEAVVAHRYGRQGRHQHRLAAPGTSSPL